MIKFIFLALFFVHGFGKCSALGQSAPSSIRGQEQATKLMPKPNIQVPYSRATNLGGLDALVETGNSNMLANPGFEHSTYSSGWTVSAGTASVDLSTFQDGKKAMSLSLSAVTGTILEQCVTPSSPKEGLLLQHSLFVKTALSNLQVCAVNGTTEMSCTDVTATDKWIDVQSLVAGPASGALCVRLKSTASVTGTVKVDAGHVGLPKSVASGYPFDGERSVRATINISGASACSVISQNSVYGIGNWISGCSASSSQATLTIVAGVFSGNPSCTCTTAGSIANDICRFTGALPTTTTIGVGAFNTSNVAQNELISLVCQGPQ